MFPPYGNSTPFTSGDITSSFATDDESTALSTFVPTGYEASISGESSVPNDAESLAYLFTHALRFFEPSFATTDGVMAQVPSMFQVAPEGSHIRSAMNALALERLGLDTQDPDLLAQAQSEYGRTLLQVREALGDNVLSREDETLVTIQLLCHFELLYCIDRWYAFEDVLGELCEVPNYPDNTGLRLMRIAREVNRLQTRIIALKQAHLTDRSALLNAARDIIEFGHEIDNRLQQWSASIEDVWKYTLVDADKIVFENDRFANQIHVYPNIWIARIWNGWRTIRINLHTALNELLNWSQATLSADLPEERRRLFQTIQSMVDEVCNTVHYHLGNRTSQDPEPIANFPTRGAGDQYETHAMHWGWFHLLVPLRTCHKAPALLPRQRQWVYRSLVRISRLARQSNNRPAPSSPPVLMTQQLPSNAFAFPMFISYPGDEGPRFAPASAEMDFFDFEHQGTGLSPSRMPSGTLPSQSAEYAIPPSYMSGAPVSPTSAAPGGRVETSSPPQVDLPFFNTTRPDQIKDPETQKKIRRDVMLHHMRNQDPKAREERQRKARAGSAARAASRRERSGTSGERKESGSEGASAVARTASSTKKASMSGRGKERAR
ncbi:MAG: hypothetical protein Q9162_000023 [Coniocarpon cinnabarinum]